MKDDTEKFRLPKEQKEALRKAARLAQIPASVLIRLCLTSHHHIRTSPSILRRTISRRNAALS